MRDRVIWVIQVLMAFVAASLLVDVYWLLRG